MAELVEPGMEDRVIGGRARGAPQQLEEREAAVGGDGLGEFHGAPTWRRNWVMSSVLFSICRSCASTPSIFSAMARRSPFCRSSATRMRAISSREAKVRWSERSAFFINDAKTTESVTALSQNQVKASFMVTPLSRGRREPRRAI